MPMHLIICYECSWDILVLILQRLTGTIMQEVIPLNGNASHETARSSQSNPSPGFLCPLTGIIMRDPVVLGATLISYEREAITWWLQAHPGRCPVTGRPVEDPSVSPDDELRLSITSWAARYAPHLMVSTASPGPG